MMPSAPHVSGPSSGPGNPAIPHVYFGQVESTSVLKLTGPIRFVAAQALRQFVDTLIARVDHGGVLIDLRWVDVIDSTGMGLLARIGRTSLQRLGRRAVIACPNNDVAICLRSVAFDELFVMLETYPFDDDGPALAEIPLAANGCGPTADELGLGRVILDAHRDLASVSERNLAAYRDVIAALEADLRATQHPPSMGDAQDAGAPSS
jgi:anti-anti-sigma factor